MYNLNGVLEIAEVNNEQVIVKVNANDPLTVARYPFLDAQMNYITITRGDNHVFTIIKNDGSTWSFSFGSRGYTLIADSVKLLKDNVLKFIKENKIPLDYNGGTPVKCSIFFNSNFKRWQLSTDLDKGHFNYWSDTATDLESAIKDFADIVTADEWKQSTAVTGISVWKPVNPKFTIK